MDRFLGFGAATSPFLRTPEKGSEVYDVESTQQGFILRVKPGQDAEFDELAERVMNHPDSFTAFGERNGRGGYKALWVTPDE